MKNYFVITFVFLSLPLFGQQNQGNKTEYRTLNYEEKIARKACIYLSRIDTITTNPKQVIIKSILRATDTVHLEDSEKKYDRDWTVEGIRGLNKKVMDLLIRDCEVVSNGK